jgi:mannose-6-phosphate isomerase-like protein (cupin superfamily)
MTSLLFPMGPKPTPSLNGIWEYWRPPGSSIVELGTVRGLDVALPIHFHEEDQLTFVLSGRRRFVIGDEVFAVSPGQDMHISAGTPHRSLSEPSEVVCINIYTSSGAYAARDLISSLARHWRRKEQIGWPDLTIIAGDH